MTSGILPVHLLFLALDCLLDCFSRSFASFIAALHALSSFLCFSSSSFSCFFNSLFFPLLFFFCLSYFLLSFSWRATVLVNACRFPVVTFFFGLFATEILSSSDRANHCVAIELLFDTTDTGGVFSDSDTELSAEPDDEILPNNEGTC